MGANPNQFYLLARTEGNLAMTTTGQEKKTYYEEKFTERKQSEMLHIGVSVNKIEESSVSAREKGMAVKVTVYTKPGCVQCNATCKALDKQRIAYRKIDVTRDCEAREYVIALGYLQAPVVVAGDQHWSGFSPDRIKQLSNPAVFTSNAAEVSA